MSDSREATELADTDAQGQDIWKMDIPVIVGQNRPAWANAAFTGAGNGKQVLHICSLCCINFHANFSMS
jgi:hypothetical protein